MSPNLSPEPGPQIITLFAAGMLVVQLLMVPQRMLLTNILLFAVQSLFLGLIAAAVAFFHHAHHVYLMALLTLAIKGLLLPWFLRRLVRQIGIDVEMHPWINAPAAMLLCGGFTLLGYVVARPFSATAGLGGNTLGVAIALVLIGFFLMINRRRAISQVLALLAAENGLFLAAIALTTYGLPFVVELGIFFDLFIAVMVLGILVFRIRATFATIDVDRLNQLRG
jgi:hydrogenase-4 component E